MKMGERKSVQARINLGNGKFHEMAILVPADLNDEQIREHIRHEYEMVRQYMEDSADQEPLPLEDLVRSLFPERYPEGTEVHILPLVSTDRGGPIYELDYPPRTN